MEPTPVPPIERIRRATADLHARLDASAFAQAVFDGSLPIARYASYLRALHVLHGGLETALEVHANRELRAAYPEGAQRRARLEQDLAHLKLDVHGVDAAALHALVLAQRIRLDAQRHRAALLGHVYVLEGSQLGGLALRSALSKRPELAAGGLCYLEGHGSATSAHFDRFVAGLSAQLRDEADLSAAISGAQHVFEGFEAMLEALMSERLDGPRLAEVLNRDAGTHSVPSDVREVQAALLAGEQSYRTWAYYEARYGERGLRFTRSDSAWLATLSRNEPQSTLRQVDWLARVLAARGMPRLLMEQHLELLHAKLVEFLPDRAGFYEPLHAAASQLAVERESLLGMARALELAREFERAWDQPPCAARPISAREAGLLIVAAVLDEKRGIPQAVESLYRWLGDAARFGEAWCRAAEHTLQITRAAC